MFLFLRLADGSTVGLGVPVLSHVVSATDRAAWTVGDGAMVRLVDRRDRSLSRAVVLVGMTD